MAKYSNHKLILFSLLPLLLQQIHLSWAQLGNRAAYWFPEGGSSASDIDSSLFTTLHFAFAHLNPENFSIFISPQNFQTFANFTSTVQTKNPNIKTLISIGGADAANKAPYAAMVGGFSRRQSFIQSSIALARANGFHGLDLDWEFPSNSTQMMELALLMDEWRAAVADEASSTGRPPLLLAAAVYYSPEYESFEYLVPALARSLDWINVMAYDFYGPEWSNLTGPPAALYNPQSQISGDSGIKAWISAGFPANKIILGLPFYGYAWTLSNPYNNTYFAPTNGSALGGAVTYWQIRQFIANNEAATVYNSSVIGDYCYSGTTWIGYDDYQSIVDKVKYIKGIGLGGYFAWHVGADDNARLARAAWQTWESDSDSQSDVQSSSDAKTTTMNWWYVALSISTWCYLRKFCTIN